MKTIVMLMCAVLIAACAQPALCAGADQTEDFTKHPGYVDFNMIKIFGDEEPKVEVNLKQPLLKLVSDFSKKEDPELVNMLEKLYLVRVYVFDADKALTTKFNSESSKTIKMLDTAGWERVVRVHDDEDNVYVYLKPSKEADLIQGLVVIALEKDDEAVFVNIVGDIRPEDVGRLGHYLKIEELDSLTNHGTD